MTATTGNVSVVNAFTTELNVERAFCLWRGCYPRGRVLSLADKWVNLKCAPGARLWSSQTKDLRARTLTGSVCVRACVLVCVCVCCTGQEEPGLHAGAALSLRSDGGLHL